MKTEIYTYSRFELEQNKAIMNEKKNNNNDILYITENNLSNLYLPNSSIVVGIISYVNNLVFTSVSSFNSSIGTIITKDGSLVFNFNYILKFMDSKPDENLILSAKPTFISGKYSNYKNIKITVQILKLTGDRILSIEYDEI